MLAIAGTSALAGALTPKEKDDRIVEEVANIADRQTNVVEQKKNQLANIYDIQIARGER